MTIRIAVNVAVLTLMLQACADNAETQPAASEEGPQQSSEDIGIAAFASSDRNQDGVIDAEEVETMANSMFVSMDYDDDGAVTPEEFDAWDFGLVTTSESEGKLDEFRTAKRILFALQDLNSNRLIDAEEHLTSLELGFSRADRDRNGAMGKDEYSRGFLPNIVFRAAIDPSY